MNILIFLIHFVLVLATTGGLCGAEESDLTLLTKEAAGFYKSGNFEDAEKVYNKILAVHPENTEALTAAGRLALYSNRLSLAERYLKEALRLDARNTQAKEFLAEALYRRDDFAGAARLLDIRESEGMIRKLESFAGQTPYATEGPALFTTVKLANTDPLPAVQVRINGQEPVYFLIDTGGSEIIIDSEYALEASAKLFGKQTSTFAGGKQGTYEHARVDSIQIGEFVVKNVPAHVMPARAYSAAAGGKRIDGIIGTVFLYHFCSTIDYQKEELALRKKGSCGAKSADPGGAGKVEVPFWMVGDHLIVAQGIINASVPTQLLVDTGLAGFAFTAPDTMLKEAAVEIPDSGEVEGVGGGGKVKVVPFSLKELSLGEIVQKDVPSLAGPFPPMLEYKYGFRIGGLVSHSFFRSYAVTFDFEQMRLLIEQ